MRESSMMRETDRSSPEAAGDIEIGSFRGEGQRQCCKRRFAIESGPAQARARQKVSERFQAVSRILIHDAARAGLSNVKASGTISISAGRLPISSPSAST